MKNKIKIMVRLFAVLLLTVQLLSLSVYAEPSMDGGQDGDIVCKNSDKAYAIYLYNATLGQPMFAKNIDKAISPASTVKMMTALVATEVIKDTSKNITVTQPMIEGIEANTMKLKVGEVISVDELLIGLVCGGYNDAAQALAVISSGSVEAFVGKMNEKARSLGAMNTVYKEPTGINDGAQTTAEDTMIIARAFLNNQKLAEYSSLPSYKITATNLSGERALHNKNALKSSYTGSRYLNADAIGMNAGMTSGGGYCVVTGVRNGGMDYICVVMGAKYDADSSTIYSYVVANELIKQVVSFSDRIIVPKNQAVGAVKVEGAALNVTEVDVYPAEDVVAYLPTDYESSGKLKVSYIYSRDSISTPVSAGETVGKIVVTYGSEVVAVTDITIGEDVERELVTYVLYVIRTFLTSRAFVLILVSLVAVIFTKKIIENKKNRHKRGGRKF